MDLKILSCFFLKLHCHDENAWFIDFGASTHMPCNRNWFDKYYENNDGACVYLGVQGHGMICVDMPGGQKKQIHNVMYVLGIK